MQVIFINHFLQAQQRHSHLMLTVKSRYRTNTCRSNKNLRIPPSYLIQFNPLARGTKHPSTFSGEINIYNINSWKISQQEVYIMGLQLSVTAFACISSFKVVFDKQQFLLQCCNVLYFRDLIQIISQTLLQLNTRHLWMWITVLFIWQETYLEQIQEEKKTSFFGLLITYLEFFQHRCTTHKGANCPDPVQLCHPYLGKPV